MDRRRNANMLTALFHFVFVVCEGVATTSWGNDRDTAQPTVCVEIVGLYCRTTLYAVYGLPCLFLVFYWSRALYIHPACSTSYSHCHRGRRPLVMGDWSLVIFGSSAITETKRLSYEQRCTAGTHRIQFKSRQMQTCNNGGNAISIQCNKNIKQVACLDRLFADLEACYDYGIWMTAWSDSEQQYWNIVGWSIREACNETGMRQMYVYLNNVDHIFGGRKEGSFLPVTWFEWNLNRYNQSKRHSWEILWIRQWRTAWQLLRGWFSSWPVAIRCLLNRNVVIIFTLSRYDPEGV